MPDISMCENQECPSKKKCYRFIAKPNSLWQAYADFKPKKDKKKCEDFMKILNKTK
jgi:hypothetical protein